MSADKIVERLTENANHHVLNVPWVTLDMAIRAVRELEEENRKDKENG